jgi:hypothetical protein
VALVFTPTPLPAETPFAAADPAGGLRFVSTATAAAADALVPAILANVAEAPALATGSTSAIESSCARLFALAAEAVPAIFAVFPVTFESAEANVPCCTDANSLSPAAAEASAPLAFVASTELPAAAFTSLPVWSTLVSTGGFVPFCAITVSPDVVTGSGWAGAVVSNCTTGAACAKFARESALTSAVLGAVSGTAAAALLLEAAASSLPLETAVASLAPRAAALSEAFAACKSLAAATVALDETGTG